MASKWRIKICTHYDGSYYVLQKRLFGFLWWYNPDNINGCITGVYDRLDEAVESYRRKTYRRTTLYIDVPEGSET